MTILGPLKLIGSRQTEGDQHLPHKAAEDLGHVGVVSSGLWDGDAQLSVAHGAQGTDPSSADPDDERQAHRAGMLQNPLR